MRVIVTGSRDYSDADLVRRELSALSADHPDLYLSVGDCPTGADAHARAWAVTAWPGPECWRRVFQYYADWEGLGRAAGPVRNEAMVAAGADLVLAFYQPGAANRGTADCVRRARAAGIEVREYGKDGT